MENLKSTVNEQGNSVTQIIHFIDGVKRTYHGILPTTIKQGQFTKMKCKDGTMLMINDNNVLCIEIFKEDENEN
tara:strand:+ start:798 stop:1019 length:222 start_codon:yes stop_codon:yes gene_type:complete